HDAHAARAEPLEHDEPPDARTALGLGGVGDRSRGGQRDARELAHDPLAVAAVRRMRVRALELLGRELAGEQLGDGGFAEVIAHARSRKNPLSVMSMWL